MNSINTIFKVQIFGESHGAGVGVVLDHVPPGIPLSDEDFISDMNRRKGGQKGGTPRVEADIPELKTGVFKGHTTGAPLMIWIANENTRSGDYEKQRDVFRPGHADFVANVKYQGFEDFRGGGHFSARLTAGLVAAGVIAKKILSTFSFEAAVTEVAGLTDPEKGLEKAIAAKDSVGGIVSCTITGVPVGLGEPFWDSVESRLAQAMFAIPAVKGIEFGAGFEAARMFGTEHNDTYLDPGGNTVSNHAGGVLGGISNGNPIIFKLAIKPTASTPKNQQTYNHASGAVEDFSVKGRHDLCVALRAPVIVEAMAALVITDLYFLAQSRRGPTAI
ncbi:MAG: chorismate synthase [Bacteroidetes bacterium 43-16]|nr:MAG: chorismate synthase [Bacteroidetes bacterium 43-16]